MRVLLIYPYFKPKNSRSIFRFPPLGVCYVAASLQLEGHDVRVLDCTFTTVRAALEEAARAEAEVVGIYSMITMQEESIMFAQHLRSRTGLLVAGGPLPSCDPAAFLDDFDVVVMGEGERTMAELVRAYAAGDALTDVAGISYRDGLSWEENALSDHGRVVVTPPRPLRWVSDTCTIRTGSPPSLASSARAHHGPRCVAGVPGPTPRRRAQ